MRPLSASFDLSPGDVLAGKYRIERLLGSGGMSSVVAARDLEREEWVAVKFLLPDSLASQEAQARFAREASASARIRSEHVARTIEVGGFAEGRPYIVMEYLEGADLQVRLRQRGTLPVPEAVSFVLEACEGLADAHALGIVHRDLKPSNLFVVRAPDGSESIKVLDFGISKVFSGLDENALTRTLSIVGTPQYMSPEQMASAHSVDARSDIWALGATLYELLAGRPPFQARTIPELCAMVLMQPTPSVRDHRPEIPSELDAAIQRCLAKTPEARYQDVAEFAAALADFGAPHSRQSADRIARVLQAAAATPRTLRSVPVPVVTGAAEADTGQGHSSQPGDRSSSRSPAYAVDSQAPQLTHRAPQIAVLREDEHHVGLCYANVFVCIWRGHLEPRICASLYDTVVDLAAKTQVPKVGIVSIVGPSAKRLTPPMREALARLHEDPEQVVYRTALVVPRVGFIAAIIRSVALNLAQRGSRHGIHKTFDQAEGALLWVTDGLLTPARVRIPIPTILLALEAYLGPEAPPVPA